VRAAIVAANWFRPGPGHHACPIDGPASSSCPGLLITSQPPSDGPGPGCGRFRVRLLPAEAASGRAFFRLRRFRLMCASGLHPAGAVAALGQDSRRAGGCAHWSAPDGHPSCCWPTLRYRARCGSCDDPLGLVPLSSCRFRSACGRAPACCWSPRFSAGLRVRLVGLGLFPGVPAQRRSDDGSKLE
jgi:hypothetical protein